MIDPKLFREYFEYSSVCAMSKNLNKTIGSGKNRAQVNVIKDRLAKLIKEFKSSPTSDAKNLETEITCWKLLNLLLTLIN